MSNPYLQKVLAAEDEGAKLLAEAKERRVKKMASAAAEADQEAILARTEEEKNLENVIRTKFGDSDDAMSQLEEISKEEIAMVKKDFKANRGVVQKYLMERVLHVDLSLGRVQKRFIEDSAQGRTKGYV